MKRRNFFKKLGIGIGGLIIAPKLLAESVKEVHVNKITKIPESVKDRINELNGNTWVKYADTPNTGMSDNPKGKVYVGFAFNQKTKIQSDNYLDYTWLKNSDLGSEVNYYPTKKESYDGIPVDQHFIHDEIGHWDLRRFTPKL